MYEGVGTEHEDKSCKRQDEVGLCYTNVQTKDIGGTYEVLTPVPRYSQVVT